MFPLTPNSKRLLLEASPLHAEYNETSSMHTTSAVGQATQFILFAVTLLLFLRD